MTLLRFKIPKKQPKIYPKAKVDPKVYPEHWRKKDYEGDHSDTWEPFQGVRLEQIVKEKQELYVRVRKMYRQTPRHPHGARDGKNEGIFMLVLDRRDSQDASTRGCIKK